MSPIFRHFGFGLLAVAAAAGCNARATGGPPKVAVSVARAERRSVPYEIGATGTVEPIRTVGVTSQVGGLLQQVRFAEGDEVRPGQVLFEIDPRPFVAAVEQAEANLSRDVAQAENAVRDAERYRALATDQSVTQQDYQQKAAAAAALVATVRADSAALRIARLNRENATIRAPIAGRTGSLLVHEGNLVRAGDPNPLVTINQLRPILVRFAVPEAQLPDVQRYHGQPLRVVAGARDSTTGLEGRLAFVDNHVDSATGTVLLKGRFPNEDGRLWPGEFIGVTLILGMQTDATVVPSQAVLSSQQGTYVYVVTQEGTVTQRPVTVQRVIDTLSVIAAGLDPGMLVVTDGQLRLTPDSRVEIRTGPKTEANPPEARP